MNFGGTTPKHQGRSPRIEASRSHSATMLLSHVHPLHVVRGSGAIFGDYFPRVSSGVKGIGQEGHPMTRRRSRG